jgi:3-oxoacyl-[acyl-carrier protein] reductase
MSSNPLPVADLLDLRGRMALVTGASGGIGGSIALRLAEAGASVALHFHRNQTAAAELAATIQAQGGRACALGADLRDEAAVAQLFAQAERELGAVDILVNNAADQSLAPLAGMDLQTWRAMLSSSLDSAFLTTQVAARSMAARGGGAVVNIASIEALAPAAGHAHYASAKAALLMFTRAAALEYGHQGVRVNAVSPGLIDRPGLATDWIDGVQRWQAAAPLGRLGQGSDVADAVLFLSSNASRWISGANLVVDGGVSARPSW